MKYKYDEVYDIVVAMAKTKMMMNAHKGSIENVDTDTLIQCGKDEFIELGDAIHNAANGADNYVHIVEEVADVVNFAVAAAYNAIENYRNRKND